MMLSRLMELTPKYRLFLVTMLLLPLCVSLYSCQQNRVSCDYSLSVFPGATGFGTETPAGRCGSIIKVTNLADDGPGSLRAALALTGARTVVFEVSGNIELEKDLEIHDGFITVAGQTAPSPGITLKGAGLRIYANDVLVQHLRVRVGDEPRGAPASSSDAIQVLGPKAYNIVIDHISASWAIDENISTWYPLYNVTISNSIISEGLHYSLHEKGPHSNGVLIGDHSRDVSLLGNLFAHNAERNPRISGDTSVFIANNLIYNHSSNTGWLSIGGLTGPSLVTVIGNKFIDGPDTNLAPSAISVRKTAQPGSKIYRAGNKRVSGRLYKNDAAFDPAVSTPPVMPQMSSTYLQPDIEELVLSSSGARPVDRDAVDLRIVEAVRARGGKVINSQRDVGSWPNLAVNYREFQVPKDPNCDTNNNGYSNLEELLHQMAAEVEGRVH